MTQFFLAGAEILGKFERVTPFNYMIPANVLWKKGSRSFYASPMFKKCIDASEQWFMDSGAFSLLKDSEDYPYTPRELFEKSVSVLKPTIWSSMDFPCNRDSVDDSNWKDCVDKGNQNAMTLLEFWNENPVGLYLPVIQGFKGNFDYCIDEFKRLGLGATGVCVGGLVGQDVELVVKVLTKVRREFPDVYIHALGVAARGLAALPKNTINSCDSISWRAPCLSGQITIFDGERLKYAYVKANPMCPLKSHACEWSSPKIVKTGWTTEEIHIQCAVAYGQHMANIVKLKEDEVTWNEFFP